MAVCCQAAGELLDLQKLSPAAHSCVFSGLQAGSLYRLQVVSWSRRMSSDSSVLARTGQWDVLVYVLFGFRWIWFELLSPLSSAVPSPVSSLQIQSSNQTDRLTVVWQPGSGSWSNYQVRSKHDHY